jgi:signal transduction histidine kinase
MAHELRAPLNSIVIHLELLADAVAAAPGGVPGGAPSGATVDAAAGGRSAAGRAGRYVGVLQEEMKRLNRLLLAFLSQSAPPSDAVRDFDLSEQCAEIVTLVGPQATRQRSELGFRVADGGGPRPVIARGNADHVRQALLSLVVNALEAVAGRNGARVEIEAGERDGEAYVAVTDNGPGIDPEIAGRIFDMHFTRKETGSGVGLAVARSIAERQGGRLSASDAPRGGARFELVLPAGPPTGAAEA